MTEKPADLRAFIADKVAQTLARCTRCGRCYEACPMPAYSDELSGADGKAVVGGILGMLRGDTGDPKALEWARICSQSATCIPACPEGVDPMMMLRIARMTALGSLGGPRLIPGRDDPEFFLRIMAFARLQLTDAERAVWQKPPLRTPQAGGAGTGEQPQ
jgi:L-lactate utilization protein LutB